MKLNETMQAMVIAVVVALTLCANFVMAGPTAEMVKEVIDYYYGGEKKVPF